MRTKVDWRPEKLYRVSEIIQQLREHDYIISRQTLHNYTMLGLIKVAKRTPAGHRLYAETVFAQLAKIERLKRHHTLNEVKRLLAVKK